MSETIYLGKGESYPFEPNSAGGVLLTAGRELVKQAIADRLLTPQGSVYNLEQYGSLLYKLNFVQNDNILKSLIVFTVSEALFEEKRIRLISVDCEQIGPAEMSCRVTYIILAANEIDSFVFPFYKELNS